MKYKSLNTAVALSVLATGCSTKDEFNIHRVDDGKNRQVLVYDGQSPAGVKGHVLVGCKTDILRAEIEEPGGYSSVATTIKGFKIYQDVPTSAARPMTEEAALNEVTRTIASRKGIGERSNFDFSIVCDSKGNAIDSQTRKALRKALEQAPTGNLAERRQPLPRARINLASFRR